MSLHALQNDAYEIFLNHTLSNDEATFHTSCCVHCHNLKIWLHPIMPKTLAS